MLETYGIDRRRDRGLDIGVGGDHLVRRGEGSWSARLLPPRDEYALSISFSIDGHMVAAEPVAFHGGSQFELDGERFRFVEHCSV